MINFKPKDKYTLYDLLGVMEILRSDGGCPWDREQTHLSIRRNFIEEVYEACEAIDNGDPELLCEELGDVLLQVVFHSRIAQEAGQFDFSGVADGVCKKLIERHPHIFGDMALKTGQASEVLENWEQIKNRTKAHSTGTSTLRSVAKSLPALYRAEKLCGRAARAGLPAGENPGALSGLAERIAAEPDRAGRLIGDALFEIARLSGTAGIDPEQALSDAGERFTEEFAQREAEKEAE